MKRVAQKRKGWVHLPLKDNDDVKYLEILNSIIHVGLLEMTTPA